MKTIYLVRHGQTLFNTQHKIQGWCDSPLTELGKLQASKAKQYFIDNNITFDSAYASTSERCSDTLEIITDTPYTRLKGLKEWNFGAFEGKDECLNPKPPYGDFFKPYGGETQEELIIRMRKTMTDIAKNDPGDSILVVSHGAANANFLKSWEEYNIAHYKPGIKNCAIMVFHFDGEHFSCQEIINPLDIYPIED